MQITQTLHDESLQITYNVPGLCIDTSLRKHTHAARLTTFSGECQRRVSALRVWKNWQMKRANPTTHAMLFCTWYQKTITIPNNCKSHISNKERTKKKLITKQTEAKASYMQILTSKFMIHFGHHSGAQSPHHSTRMYARMHPRRHAPKCLWPAYRRRSPKAGACIQRDHSQRHE